MVLATLATGEIAMGETTLLGIIGLTTCIGLYMGWQFLRGVRNRPMLVGIHLLLGLGSVEVLAVILRGAPNAAPVADRGGILLAAGLLVCALLSGLAVPLIARPVPDAAGMSIATHAGIGGVAFLALCYAVLG